MAQFIVRNLEEEVRQVLWNAVKTTATLFVESRIAEPFKGLGLTDDLLEWSGQPANPTASESL